ncbi:P-loop containing nucleoside triphosphate hydrolase protein [Microdochium trichocladiopsis]|uniref:P-loop containing nucleoside triphosphate hydrolase protein n=1 Tax=Microdochium trichocladiopsis TaxID=1682393 RepID=A0A9P8Y3G1_9PEZI|nr:P-loop containing nucleoside triphosphate hydrolase protein [Microdochium trichocladiopsis]KAH7028892.1 P-loop containing nucleoside triphosphate hydrolase protein [Microdochium trichocladiopsis]
MSSRVGSDSSMLGLAGNSVSFQRLLESSAPGFRFFQRFFQTWLNLDLTSLALALTVFGALSSGAQHLQGIALRISGWITRFFTASISISGTDRLNREVLNWLGANVLARQQTRILTAQSEDVNGDHYAYRRASMQRIDFFHEKRVPIQYLPTFGVTWFFHERNLFFVRRVPDSSASRSSSFGSEMPDEYAVAPSGYEPLVVMCLGRSVNPVKRFLSTCRDFAEKQREAFITVRASRNQHYREAWDTTILRPMRPLATVHFDKTVKDELVADIENYLKASTRRFYMERGIPYRRGYLLHGPPGTGKTSLSLALAGYFGLELYLLHLPTIREDGDLERLFVTLPPQCIVLIEDIDAVGLKRQQKQDDNDDGASRPLLSPRAGHCTLSGLLNVLDGVASQEGRIVLMTSNFADKLDEALVRPGRIDRMIFLGNISKDAARLMFLRMYMPDHSADLEAAAASTVQVDEEQLAELAAEFGEIIPDHTFTPAQLQGYLLKYRNAPIDATKDLAEWSEKEMIRMEEARAREKEAAERRAKKKAQAGLRRLRLALEHGGGGMDSEGEDGDGLERGEVGEDKQLGDDAPDVTAEVVAEAAVEEPPKSTEAAV